MRQKKKTVQDISVPIRTSQHLVSDQYTPKYRSLSIVHRLPLMHIIIIITICAAIWLSYHISLSAQFQLDDGLWISQNSDIHMKDFSWKQLITDRFKPNNPGRWFVFVTLTLNYYFSWLVPYGFRLTNVIIHMVAAAMLYLIALNIMRRLNIDSNKTYDNHFMSAVAFFSAIAWALSPLQTSAVTYIIQRMTSMAGMLCLASLVSYISGRDRKRFWRWVWYIVSIVLWILALGSKQIAAVLPMLIVLYELYFYRDLKWTGNPERQRLVVRSLLLSAILCFVLILWQGNAIVGKLGGEQYSRYPFDVYQRLLSQPRILLYYLGLVFWPLPGRIAVDPSFFKHSENWLEPWTTIPSLLILSGIIWSAWYLRRREKLLSFAICWFMLSLVIEQSFIPLQLVFHHRLYLAGTMLVVAAFYFIARMADRFKIIGPMLIFGTGVVAMLGFGAYERNDVWNSPYRLWEAELKLDPNSTRIMINLSREYLNTGQSKQAIAVLFRVLDKDPKNIQAFVNLSHAYSQIGMPEKAIFYLKQGARMESQWPINEALSYWLTMAESQQRLKNFSEAEASMKKAIEIATEDRKGMSYFRLANIYQEMGETDKAIESVEQSVKLMKKFYEGYFYLGSLLASQGNFTGARDAFENAIGGEPAVVAKAYRHLAGLAEWEKDKAKALDYYLKALAVEPDDALTLLNVGSNMANQGQLESAMEYYRRVIQSGNMQYMHQAYYNLGKMALDRKEYRAAFDNFQNAYNLNSGYPPVLFSLGNMQLDMGNTVEGKKLLTRLLEVNPDHAYSEMIKNRLKEDQ